MCEESKMKKYSCFQQRIIPCWSKKPEVPKNIKIKENIGKKINIGCTELGLCAQRWGWGASKLVLG